MNQENCKSANYRLSRLHNLTPNEAPWLDVHNFVSSRWTPLPINHEGQSKKIKLQQQIVVGWLWEPTCIENAIHVSSTLKKEKKGGGGDSQPSTNI